MSNIQHNNEVLVKVEGLSKKFCKDLKTSLWYGVKDLVSGVRGSNVARELRPKEFWAVKDINFELRRGECLGLIGHNGAGKSTLLKILNGLINPDAGTVTIKGRVGALIELGAGFNPILTGRENIYNNGAILGFTRQEIDQKLEEIIDFAEIREFIDMPVQHYSSGMKVRLGFAVAAQMEPDVLIIDEVLAVGDIGFRIKCLNRINKLLNNTAVIFVSHSMPQVTKVSSRILLMNKGQCEYNDNNVNVGIEKYYDKFKVGKYHYLEKGLKLKEVKGKDKWHNTTDTLIMDINYLDDLIIYFRIEKEQQFNKLGYVLRIFDKSFISVATCQEYFDTTVTKFGIKIPKIQLGAGNYELDIYFIDYDNLNNENIIAHYKNFVTLRVKESKIVNPSSFQLLSQVINLD
ncbi:ABC transporter ATP-binding protein [Corallibacter sp.]|uniref:ABC transporter ATP-binding protein n=1 Tax=Corallibacter sp. TaxID=2038084 RepID=UPI003A8CCEBA